jgi:hypothetical protein
MPIDPATGDTRPSATATDSSTHPPSTTRLGRSDQQPTRSRPASVAAWTVRLLLAVTGLVGVYASIYFSFFASPEEGGVSGAVDWMIAAWAMGMAIGYLAAAIALGRLTLRIVQATAGLVSLHILFNVIKVVGYGEAEALPMIAVDLLILGLLAASHRSAPR